MPGLSVCSGIEASASLYKYGCQLGKGAVKAVSCFVILSVLVITVRKMDSLANCEDALLSPPGSQGLSCLPS